MDVNDAIPPSANFPNFAYVSLFSMITHQRLCQPTTFQHQCDVFRGKIVVQVQGGFRAVRLDDRRLDGCSGLHLAMDIVDADGVALRGGTWIRDRVDSFCSSLYIVF